MGRVSESAKRIGNHNKVWEEGRFLSLHRSDVEFHVWVVVVNVVEWNGDLLREVVEGTHKKRRFKKRKKGERKEDYNIYVWA